jgi:hypothetical protein
LFLKRCVNLLQGVFYPDSGLLADQGVAGKGIPIGGIDGLTSGTSTAHTLLLSRKSP